jgi:hypothetical protein
MQKVPLLPRRLATRPPRVRLLLAPTGKVWGPLNGSIHKGTEGMASPTRKTRPKRPPGPPYEVVIWRVTRNAIGRGEKREVYDTVLVEPQWEPWFWQTKDPGPGRYRIEIRDAKMAIVAVRYANQTIENRGRPPLYTSGRTRPPGTRKLRAPVHAYDTQTPTIEQQRRHEAQRRLQPRAPQRTAQPQTSRPGQSQQAGSWTPTRMGSPASAPQSSGQSPGAYQGPRQHPVHPQEVSPGATRPAGQSGAAPAASSSARPPGARPPGPDTSRRS